MNSYDKALKKLAAQISRTIKDDTTYRNIPFGDAQLDIHSDGENVLLAVKILDSAKNSFNVREFQMPFPKLQKFLVGEEMRILINNSDISISRSDENIMKQISQGIAQLINDSQKKNEKWLFPFHDHLIHLKKQRLRADYKGVEGQLSIVPYVPYRGANPLYFSGDCSVFSGILFSDEEIFAQINFTHLSLEYGIYRALTRNSFVTKSVKDYKNVKESSLKLYAA